MTTESTGAFAADIMKRIEYFCDEFDLTYAEVVWTLELIKHQIISEAVEDDDEDDFLN